MDIVLATDAFPPKIDGIADMAAIVAAMLAARGHHVRIIAPAPGPFQASDCPVVRIRSFPCPLYPELRLALPSREVAQLLRRQRPDAAIVMTVGPIGIAAVQALAPSTRLLHIYTTDIPQYLRTYYLAALRAPAEVLLSRITRRADVTLCPTERVRRDLAGRGHARLDVWGRGVDLELFRPDRRSAMMRRRLCGGEPKKPLVLYAGRLAREKRILDLLEAARRVQGVRFALVGDGPQRDLLERRFADIPAVFTGYLRGETLASALATADIFAFPSESETFGQVVLQALASGVPAIVARGSAPAEFVPHAIAGLHVEPRSPQALAAAIGLLTDDEAQRCAMGRAARRSAEDRSWATLLDRLEELLASTAPRRVHLQPAARRESCLPDINLTRSSC